MHILHVLKRNYSFAVRVPCNSMHACVYRLFVRMCMWCSIVPYVIQQHLRYCYNIFVYLYSFSGWSLYVRTESCSVFSNGWSYQTINFCTVCIIGASMIINCMHNIIVSSIPSPCVRTYAYRPIAIASRSQSLGISSCMQLHFLLAGRSRETQSEHIQYINLYRKLAAIFMGYRSPQKLAIVHACMHAWVYPECIAGRHACKWPWISIPRAWA